MTSINTARSKGFCKIGRAPRGETTLPFARHGMSRKCYNGTLITLLPRFGRGFVAGKQWHLHVHKDEVKPARAEHGIKRRLPISNDLCFHTQQRQPPLHHVGNDGCIFRNQNRAHQPVVFPLDLFIGLTFHRGRRNRPR